MDAFQFSVPTRLLVGPGSVKQFGKEVRTLGRRALVVTDKGLIQAGVVEVVLAALREAGVESVVFDQVEENPSDHSVLAGAQQCLAEGCEVVVGVGGGSAMDTAKAVALLATHPGRHPREFEGAAKLSQEPLPTAMVATTAGTASEVTYISVVTDTERMFKFPIVSRSLAPKVAVLDALLTLSKPPGLTAATGMDALTHAIESYTNTVYNPVADALAERAIAMIGRHLRTAVVQGANVEARAQMLLASAMAGMAFNLTRLGLVHAMSHPMSAHFGVPHGVANAALLPRIMEYNLFGCLEQTANIAMLLGENVSGLSPVAAARKGVEAVRQLARDVGIPERLSELGVKAEKIDVMAADTMLSGNVAVNPRRVRVEDVAALYRELM